MASFGVEEMDWNEEEDAITLPMATKTVDGKGITTSKTYRQKADGNVYVKTTRTRQRDTSTRVAIEAIERQARMCLAENRFGAAVRRPPLARCHPYAMCFGRRSLCRTRSLYISHTLSRSLSLSSAVWYQCKLGANDVLEGVVHDHRSVREEG